MNLNKYLPWLTTLFVFIVYLFTLAPSVIQIDSGELAAVQINAGIAHPTGYPLFTITGYLWSLIPSPFSGILQMNLLAAVWTSLAAGIFVSTSFLFFRRKEVFINVQKAEIKKKKKKAKTESKTEVMLPDYYYQIAAVSAALILAFSRTFWFQSTSVEVYSLHLFLITLIIYSLIKAYIEGTDRLADKHWIIFSIFLGLGFTNHMTTLLILPGTAYLYFNKYGFNKRAFTRLAIMIAVFIPILALIYAYLPFRASQNPSLNWGTPIDLERILWHISGKQYQVWLFSSSDAAKQQLGYFFSNITNEFGLSLIPIIAGIFLSYKYSRKIFIFLLICFVSTVAYSINYDIIDIDTYFLLAYISLAFFSIFLFLFLLRKFYPSGKGYKTVIVISSVLIFLQAYLNFRDVNQSGNYAFEDYTKALMNSLPENSIVFGYQWDFLISPSYYFQFAEGFRKDIAVIDKELLRRSWYYNQLTRNYPEVMKGIETETDIFTKVVAPFERDEPYDYQIIEKAYRNLMTGLVAVNIENRAFYITPELFENEMTKGQFVLPEGYTVVPDIFCFRVVKGNDYVPAGEPDFKIRMPEYKNRYINSIESFVGSMLARRAIYEMQFDKKDRAKIYIDKIKKEFPGYRMPPALSAAFN